jgi:hypothetical protein
MKRHRNRGRYSGRRAGFEAPLREVRRSDLMVSVIAASAAILGAAAGGVATYLGNHALQSSQVRSVAEGAGRVLQGDFRRAATRIEAELFQHRYYLPGRESTITIDAQDEEKVAANVSAGTWDHIVAAQLTIQDEQETANSNQEEVLKARAHQVVVLRGNRLTFERASLHNLERAADALTELTGTASAE